MSKSLYILNWSSGFSQTFFCGMHLVKFIFAAIQKQSPGGLQLYSKRDPGTGVFLWILQNFQEQLFFTERVGDVSPTLS